MSESNAVFGTFLSESNFLNAIFEAKATPDMIQAILDLLASDKIRFKGFTTVKPYLSVDEVGKALTVLRGKCIPENAFENYARRVGISLTNFRRMVTQYIGMGMARRRGFLVCFDSNAIPLPVFVNNVRYSNRLGVRTGTTMNAYVLLAFLLLNHNVELYTSSGVITGHGEVVMTVFASWYTSSIRWEDKKKNSPVESELTVLTHVWVDSEDNYQELLHSGELGFLEALS